jgi:transcriptional regulator PpsR
LFHSAAQPVLIADVVSLRVIEANPAAVRVLGAGQKRLVGKSVLDAFGAHAAAELRTLFEATRGRPGSQERLVSLANDKKAVRVSASMFRQESGTFLIIHIEPAPGRTTGRHDAGGQGLEQIIGTLPDAFVVTDQAGRIRLANTAFLELVQLATEDQVRDRPLDRWIGRAPVDTEVLLANLRQRGSVRRFATVARGEFGASADIEIAAVAALETPSASLGFVIRRQDGPAASTNGGAVHVPALAQSVEKMTHLVGRVPMRDLVREATDIIERMCIEAALQLTNDNRASAAEMLGLSRQGLYMKLRRYGIDDVDQPSNK